MWLDVRGHDDVARRFRRLLAKDRLATTYLFVGPEGIGKRLFARRLAGCLLCQEIDDVLLDRCGRCESCRLIAADNHPDLETIQRHADRQELTLDLFIGDREHRNREGLCHRLALTPTLGRRRIAIIDDADYFNDESANALLKTLEEPPPRTLILLVGTTANRQLPTIRSRCQIVRFRPLDTDTIVELLLEEETASDRQQAQMLAERSEGSLARARVLFDRDVAEFCEHLRERLSAPRLDGARLGKALREFVENAGTETRLKRARLRLVLRFAADHYRNQMHSLVEQDRPSAQASDSVLTTGKQVAPRGAEVIDLCVRRLDRCLEGMVQLERNANLSTLMDCWLDDLAHA